MAQPGLFNIVRRAAKEAALRARHNLHNQVANSPLLEAAIDAERHALATVDAGAINYYVDSVGGGRPLLLLHGIHAAASAFEMRNLFEEFRGERPVYALDLPGFGFSQRGGMPYSALTYVHAISHMLQHIADECDQAPVDIIASSLTSEYAAQVATDRPDLVQSLVMLSPTGFGTKRETHAIARDARRGTTPRLWKVLAEAGGELFYDALVTRTSLAFYLRKSFAGHIDRDLLDYEYMTSHQPGAQYAPLAFISGDLFPVGDPMQAYAKVGAPVLVLHDEDPYTGFGALRSFLQQHANYDGVRIPHTRGLPQIEACDRSVRAIRAFWDRNGADEITEVTQLPRSYQRNSLTSTTH